LLCFFWPTVCLACVSENKRSFVPVKDLIYILFRDESGVFISDVVEGSVAAKCAKLRQGDQILAVNGEDLRNASQERGAQALKVSDLFCIK